MAKPNPELIRIENVDVALDGRRVLAGIQWSLRAGEHWAILGRNGSGKSTFLKLVRGELWPAPGSRGRRLYAFSGQEQTTAVGIKELVALVSPEMQARYLQQDWKLTTHQVIRSGFHAGDYVYQRLSAAQEEAALAVIELVGIQDLLSRDVQTLSTGELRKVLVARALVGKPRVLVCDEICDGLDRSARESLLSVLERLVRQGTQLLYTTHREEELLSGLTHRLALEQGRIVFSEAIPHEQIAERPASRLPALEPSAPTQRRAATHSVPRISNAVGRSNGMVTAPTRFPVSLRLGLNPARLRIDIRAATVYHDQRPALRDVTLQIHEGEHWAVVGPNGSGKTTLLKLIVGDLHPSLGGQVRRFELASGHTIWDVKRRIGWVSPELQSLYREPLTAAQVIGSGFFSSVGLRQKLSLTQRRRVAEIVDGLGLQDLADQNALSLSYGEFRKILIARALVHRPELLICDEPFDGLDTASRAAIGRTLLQVAAQGTGLVVVTHHPADLPSCTTHLAALDSGRVIFQGPVAQYPALNQPADLRR